VPASSPAFYKGSTPHRTCCAGASRNQAIQTERWKKSGDLPAHLRGNPNPAKQFNYKSRPLICFSIVPILGWNLFPTALLLH
jgi:hypothetical protein